MLELKFRRIGKKVYRAFIVSVGKMRHFSSVSQYVNRVGKGCIKGVQISLRCSGFVLQERTNSAVQTAGPSEFEGTFYSPQRQTDSHGQNEPSSPSQRRVDLAPQCQPRRHVGCCSPRCPAAHDALQPMMPRWCPRPVPPPIACSGVQQELHGAGQGRAPAAMGQSRSAQSRFRPDCGAQKVVFRLMEHHPRSPGGLAGAARLRVAAPEPPTKAREQAQAVFRFVHRIPRRLHRQLPRLHSRRDAPNHPCCRVSLQ